MGRYKEKAQNIKVRKGPFDKIKKLWMEINQRYVLFYEEELNAKLPKVVAEIFARDVFKDVTLTSSRVKIASGWKRGVEAVQAEGAFGARRNA